MERDPAAVEFGPAAFQPPLTRKGEAWRYAVVLLWSTIPFLLNAAAPPSQRMVLPGWWLAAELPLGLAAAVLVHYRRRWPVTVVVATSLLGTISRVAGTFLGLALLSLATRRVWRELATGCLLVAVIGIAGWFVDPYDQRSAEGIPWWVDAVPVLSFLAVFIGSRRELVYTLRNRAERAEAERDARAAQARTAERARIAREMHDVLAHRISQVSMHAGALAFREDLPASQLREGLTDIRDRANEALQDLRGVLGVLRSDPSVEVRPQAGFGQIAELV
ncbi:MAG: hypothetical protein CSB46_09350, partial [Micrococcales bacterium]